MESINDSGMMMTDSPDAAGTASGSNKTAPAGSSSSVKDSTKQHMGAAVPLTFPESISDPVSHLAPIRDNHSAYSSVAKSCFLLNQYAGSGSSSAMDDHSTSVRSSTLFHDASFVEHMTEAFSALIDCIQTHDDRRAKIVACKTLAQLARSTYARIRHSPHLFSMRDSRLSRLEDEVGTDVPMALVNVALDDPDDGVAATAMESLGILTLSSAANAGPLGDDELLREVLSIATARSAPYAATLADLQDEDPRVPQMELQGRIFENVVSPRLLQLVCRTTEFDKELHVVISLPLLTASLVYQSKIAPPLLYDMDRATYAKRWVEVDYVNLVNDLVEVTILPSMQSSLTGQLPLVAATCGIRLVHACPHASWTLEVCQWAVRVFKEEYAFADTSPLEEKMICLAHMIVCARAIPLPERLATLQFLAHHVAELPSTSATPFGVSSPGLLLTVRGISQYRKPTRIAFWSEIALSLFKDGPVDSTDPHTRSMGLKAFLRSSLVKSMVEKPSKNSAFHVREELVMVFTSVGAEVGRHLRTSIEGDQSSQILVAASREELDEWILMALAVLNAFAPCAGWGSSPAYMEEELSFLVAAQSAYVNLLQEVLHAAGLLNQTSVSLKMAPTASPPNMLWDQMGESAEYLGMYESSNSSDKVLGPISALVDSLVKLELNGKGIVSHHMRLFILSLAADQWVQGRYLAQRREFEGTSSQGSQLNLNTNSAREILVALSPRRIFSKVVESHKSQMDMYGKKKKEQYKKYAQDTVTVCVACIENIALTACDWQKRFGSSSDTKHVLSLAKGSLEGKNLQEADEGPHAPVLPVCQGAIERIMAAFSSGSSPDIASLSLSPLLDVGELKRRPVVSATRLQDDQESYNEGYLTQLSRQIVLARADACLLSNPVVYSLHASTRKQNWLRIALPPLPSSRKSQELLSRLPRFQWGSNAVSVSGGSDATAVTLAYSMRRGLRYDGEDEFNLVVSLRLTNTTAVEISEGIRLEMGLSQDFAPLDSDSQDAFSQEVLKTLAGDKVALQFESPMASAVSIYKSELKSGDHLTWEIAFNSQPMTGAIQLNPSIVFRSIEKESTLSVTVGGDSEPPDGSTKKQEEKKSEELTDQGTENIAIPCDSFKLSPLIGLQPCPLVFFRDSSGDLDCFHLLWSRMPHQVPPLRLALSTSGRSVAVGSDILRLCALSTIRFEGELISGGFVTHLWAFASLEGRRVLFVLAESDVDGASDKTIHVRGDDVELLTCLCGTASARIALVAALAPGLSPL